MRPELAPYPVPEHLHGTQACFGADTELFFAPEIAKGRRRTADLVRARKQEAEAKAICLRCDFTDACMAYALARPSEVGIWGGLNDMERHQLRIGWRSA